jgi:hypothetical protein
MPLYPLRPEAGRQLGIVKTIIRAASPSGPMDAVPVLSGAGGVLPGSALTSAYSPCTALPETVR